MTKSFQVLKKAMSAESRKRVEKNVQRLMKKLDSRCASRYNRS